MTEDKEIEKQKAIKEIMATLRKHAEKETRKMHRELFWLKAKSFTVCVILTLPISLICNYSEKLYWISFLSFLYGMYFNSLKQWVLKWI